MPYWVFDNFILAEELFSKSLQNFETGVLANNNLWRKLFSLLESTTTFDEVFKAILVQFSLLDFNLLSWKLDSFTF